ncbi:myosin-10-like [Branchiostoma lanceolatum]|uniref:myosin-10-like n=1 Tax=Branchiostoma lanceolatum TaxID=7740 RepID=UPI003456CEA8
MADEPTSVLERCRFVSNLVPSDVQNFITTGQKPANCDAVDCSTILLLESGLREKSLSVNEHLPGLVHAIDNTVVLPTKCTNLLQAIWRKVDKCPLGVGLDSLLKSQVSSVYKVKKKEDTNKIGEECEKAGITPHVLQNGWDGPPGELKEMMVVEIEMYRERCGQTYKVVKDWLGRLLGQRAIADTSTESLRLSLIRLQEQVVKARRHRCQETLRRLCDKVYTPPGSQTRAVQQIDHREVPSTSSSKMQAAKQTARQLKQQVKEQQKEIANLEMGFEAVKRKSEQDEKKLAKKKKVLQQRETKIKEKEVKRSAKNTGEKLRRRNKAKMKWQEERRRMMEENSNLLKTNAQLKKKLELSENRRESLRVSLYKCRSKKTSLEAKLKSVGSLDKSREKEIAHLQAEVEDLQSEVAEKERPINLRDGPNKTSSYTADVRVTYMELLKYEVNTKQMSDIVYCVLTKLGKFTLDRDDLPGETFSQLMRHEANLLSTIHGCELVAGSNFSTLHGDATSRDGRKVTAFQANTGQGTTPTLGLQEVMSGESAEQLDTFKFVMQKMADLTSTADNSANKAKQLVAKMKNTMADGAASQKKFNRMLEAYRAEILPEVVNGWDDLNEEEQQQFKEMNHLYCNLHALIGFATYSDEALTKLEEVWRKQYGPLGVEDLAEFQDGSGEYAWKHQDSATQRLIRTACDAVAPGGNQQAGRIQEFKDYLQLTLNKRIEDGEEPENAPPAVTRLKPFRANRFNILFDCASKLYFHSQDLKDMFHGGYVKAGNKLLRAVLADVESEPLIAGCRALGLIDFHITEPYWRLVERKDVHILDLSTHLQTLLRLITEWSKDATPLLQQDLPPIFPIASPVKDKVHAALFEEVSDRMNLMTRQSLEVILSNLIIVLERRFSEQLRGKLSHSDDPRLRDETATTLKSNRRGENDFGYWSHLQATKPTMGLMATEGQLMFKSNNTAAWLTALSEDDPMKYYSILSQVRKERRKWQKIYKQRGKEQQEERENKLRAKAAEHEQRERKKEQQQEAQRRQLEEFGGPVKSEDEYKTFLKNLSTRTEPKQKQILRLHVSYLKAKNPVLRKSNSSIFALSYRGDQHSIQQLTANLRTIITSPEFKPDTEASTTAVQSTLPTQPTFMNEEDAADQVSRIKAHFHMKAAEVTKGSGTEESQEVEGNDNVNAEESEQRGDRTAEESEQRADRTADESEQRADRAAEESEQRADRAAEESEQRADRAAEESEQRGDRAAEDSEQRGDSDGEESEESDSDEESEEEGSDCEESEKEDSGRLPIVLNSIVVVAYEEDWEVGEVTKFGKTDSEFSVSFMTRTRKKKDGEYKDTNLFYWPNRRSVYTVERKFILTILAEERLELCEESNSSNCRTILTKIKGFEDIDRAHTRYYNMYFARRQPRATKPRIAKPRGRKST